MLVSQNLEQYAQLLNGIVLAQKRRIQRRAELVASRPSSLTPSRSPSLTASRSVSPSSSPVDTFCNMAELEQATSRQAEIRATL
jgi:hypothetical protein